MRLPKHSGKWFIVFRWEEQILAPGINFSGFASRFLQVSSVYGRGGGIGN